MGGWYDSTVALLKESSLAALPEPLWLRTDAISTKASWSCEPAGLLTAQTGRVAMRSEKAMPEPKLDGSVASPARTSDVELCYHPAALAQLQHHRIHAALAELYSRQPVTHHAA